MSKTLAPFKIFKTALVAAAALAVVQAARADVVTDWNVKANELVVEAKLGTPPAMRVMAYVQTAVLDATDKLPPAASFDAAVAAANRAVLLKLVPAVQAQTETAYQAALAAIADGPAKTAGIAAGERAAAALLARRAADSAPAESYRPHTTPGAYVPTAPAAVPTWSQRMPWLLTAASQFRPAAPPALTSETWARDYNETKDFGGRTSTRRSAEQTEAARFWDYSLPPVYHGVLRSVALQPGRTPGANARFLAAASQAMDDALISVFDAKYHYNFWRPGTAIRNGDIDGNDATTRDASWAPLIDVPMHPEYPSGHSILAGAVAAVIKGEQNGAPLPVLSTSSPTAKGAVRRWTSLEGFVREVSDARIHGGLHFRSATDAAEAMGKRIGELAVARHLAP